MKGKENTTMKSIVSAIILWCLVFSGTLSVLVINVGSGSVPALEPVLEISETIDETVTILNQGVIDLDHDVNIISGGELIVIGTTLNFVHDVNNHYSLNINGGNLTLQGSTITTGASPQAAWYPWLEMNLNNGNFTMSDYSTLAFPGWLNVTNTRTDISDSWITSIWPMSRTSVPTWSAMFPNYMDAVNVAWWLNTPQNLDDTNDDGPAMVFIDCENVTIADSRIDELVEDDNLMPPGTFTETFIPNSIDTTYDMTGENINELWYSDGFTYTLVSYPNMLWINGFDTMGFSDAGYNLLDAELYVEYNNPGYNYTTATGGINHFNYSHPSINGGNNVSAFQVGMNQPTNVNNVTNIFANVNTLSLIENLNVTFLNYDEDVNPSPPDLDAFNIDRIQIDVTLETLYTYYPQMISLDNSQVSIINTYVAVDWLDFSDDDDFPLKNAFNLTNNSDLYLYGVEIDESENDTAGGTADFMPYLVEDGSEVFSYKWLDLMVVDRYNAAVTGANVSAASSAAGTAFQLAATGAANDLNDSAMNTDEYWAEARILDYLGKTRSTYNVTGADGMVLLPLLCEFINNTNYPNGAFFGEYDVMAEVFYGATEYDTMAECDFEPFPNTKTTSVETTAQFSDLRLPRNIFSPGLVVNDANSPVSLNFNYEDAEYCYILVEDNAQLIISNADLKMVELASENFEIRVRSGGTLTLNNVDLDSESGAIPFIVEENGKANIVETISSIYVNYEAYDNANVTFLRSTVNGNFDVTDSNANVRLDATDTIFAKPLDDFAGTSIAYLKGVYSNAASFDIEPSDSAIVYVYRMVTVRVVDGSSPEVYVPSNPGQPVVGATVTVASTNVEAGIGELTYAGLTDTNGEVSFYCMSDRVTAGPSTVWVGGYLVGATYLTDTKSISIGLVAYYDGDGMRINDAEHEVYLRLDNVLPDLDPPIYLSDAYPGRGEDVTISTLVTNNGTAIAQNILVRFTDTYQGVSATLYQTYIPSLAPGESQPVSFVHSWNLVTEISTALTGPHTIGVYVDPLDTIKEQNETNNMNSTELNVVGLPDLTFVHGTDVDFSSPYPNIVVNDDFTIFAHVTNVGDVEAPDVDVEIGYYDPANNNSAVVIGMDTINVPAGSTMSASVNFAGFALPGSYRIYATIDVNNTVVEVYEDNNYLNRTVIVYEPYDLVMQQVQFLVNGVSVSEVENGTTVTIRAMIQNTGEMFASNVVVEFTEGVTLIGETGAIPTIQGINAPNNIEFASFTWMATSLGSRSLDRTISGTAVDSTGTTTLSNTASATLTITDSRPDLSIVNAELESGLTTLYENTAFNFNVTIRNDALGTTATRISVDVFDGSINSFNWLGNYTVASLAAGSQVNFLIPCLPVTGVGNHDFIVVIDPELNTTDTIPGTFYHIYGEIEEFDETNNDETVPITVVMPPLTFSWTLPSVGAQYELNVDEQITISGSVVRIDNLAMGIAGINVSVQVGTGTPVVVTTGAGGRFSLFMDTPDSIGYYDITFSANGVSGDATRQIEVLPEELSFIQEYWWIILILIIIVIAAIVGVTLYLYFVGLGKTVQCGECSAFIPEGAKKCPKCGVEFESEVAKCSVCGSWVPIDVKSCPDCGTEFTVGIEELEDYESKMKKQYDDVVAKFRQLARKDLGDKFTETEFQAWWATQATFITFDQWLKEEEEMKRMGSKPCPNCGTENSVTAKICHKCGSLMEEEEAPPKKPPVQKPVEKKPVEPEPKPAPTPAAAAPAAAAPAAAAPAATPQPRPAAQEPKKQCPSCGMEVAVSEKTCPICNYDFDQGSKPPETPPGGGEEGGAVRKVVRKPVKKVVRRPTE